MDIGRLGASPQDEFLTGVTVVWVAKSERFGRVIVGWYKQATVFRDVHANGPNGQPYSARALVKNCKLLTLRPHDERRFPVRGMGQSNRWYADQPADAAFRKRVRRYISHGELPKTGKVRGGAGWQQDIKKRLKIEEAAMKATEEYYRSGGYDTERVHRDNLGRDIEARQPGEVLQVEVKGQSGNNLCVDLTPNEYKQMKRRRRTYCLSILVGALSKNPELRVFSFSKMMNGWYDDREVLTRKEIVGARVSL